MVIHRAPKPPTGVTLPLRSVRLVSLLERPTSSMGLRSAFPAGSDEGARRFGITAITRRTPGKPIQGSAG
jgi:hypothetical protein